MLWFSGFVPKKFFVSADRAQSQRFGAQHPVPSNATGPRGTD
jgi:hypothetical protein